jgi:hypothetical protein
MISTAATGSDGTVYFGGYDGAAEQPHDEPVLGRREWRNWQFDRGEKDPHASDHMASDAAQERTGYQGAVRNRARPPPAAALPPGPRSHRGADPHRTG